MTEQQWHAGMLSGALGFGFNIRFLQDAGFQFDSDPFEPLDEYLSHWLEHDPAIRSDMAHGIVGLGIFGILRSQTSVGRHYVDMVVHWLSERVHQTDRGLFWPGLIITEPEDARTNYWHWLGVAHGVGGIVGFLAQARSLNIRVNDCELLLEGAVRYVLETKRMEKATRPPESPGWCWGDLGLGMTLVLAGQACARADWQDEGVRFARESIAQTERISTLCLCHGTSGAAHLFGRFYQISNDDEFRSAAKRMLRATLESAQKNGPARFLFEVLMSGNELSEPYPSRGFLVGSSGIGACLLSATTPGRSLWETMLLMAPATLER
jgi:hypothetical protein